MSTKRAIAAAVLLAASAMIHRKNKGSMPIKDYLQLILSGNRKGENKIVYMDYLRVTAALLVIVTHVTEPAYQALESHTWSWTWLALLAVFAHCCNLLFMMISGALILGGREESAWVFYKKRFLKVVLPCFAYYCFYYFRIYGGNGFRLSAWPKLIRSFTANNTGMTPHFWLLHVIFVFYMAAPFLRVMVKHMTEAQMAAMAAVIFLLHGIYTYGPYIQVNFVLSGFLASWESVFLLGAFCMTKIAMKYYRLIMAGGGLAALFMVWAMWCVDDFTPLIYNNAPPVMLFSCAVFLFFRKNGDRIFVKSSFLLEVMSKYSFSVLMIHWHILFNIVEGSMGINGLSLGIVGGTAASVILTMILSLLFAFIYDNTVILCLRSIVSCRLPGGRPHVFSRCR